MSEFVCAECNSVGFAPSALPNRCTFCDGTEGGNPPTAEEISKANAPKDYIISSSESDLHTLEVRRIGGLLYITTNNRKMYEKWGTLAFDEGMAQQLVEGINAVLAGASRAVTKLQLDMERTEQESRERAQQQNRTILPSPDYSTLFED